MPTTIPTIVPVGMPGFGMRDLAVVWVTGYEVGIVVSPSSTSVTYVPEDWVTVRVIYRVPCLSSIPSPDSESRAFEAGDIPDRNSKQGPLFEADLGTAILDELVGDFDPSPELRVNVSTPVSVLSLFLLLIPKRGFGDIEGQ